MSKVQRPKSKVLSEPGAVATGLLGDEALSKRPGCFLSERPGCWVIVIERPGCLCLGVLVPARTESGARVETRSIKVGQFIALAVQDVINRTFDAALIPKISLTTLAHPWAAFQLPAIVLTHLSCSIRFQRTKRARSAFVSPIDTTVCT